MRAKKEFMGSVYVLSNPAMVGMVKIGYTQHCHPQERVDDLSKQTGVPLPFNIEYYVVVDDPQRVERAVHRALNGNRVSTSKEFFGVSIDDAIKCVDLIAFGTNDETEVFHKSIENIIYLHSKYPSRFIGDGSENEKKVALLKAALEDIKN